MSRRRRPIDFGRLIARLLCALFALVGAVPLAAAIALRSRPVLDWAARETSRVLQDELGVTASYRIELTLLPLRVALHDVVVPASDGGAPFLTAESASVKPRVFALLSGKLDVGEVELTRPRARVVLRQGKLVNLAYRLPETRKPRAETDRAPFGALAVTEAELDLDIDGTRVRTGPVDLDVFAERGPSFEIGMRIGESSVARGRPVTLEAGDPRLNARGEAELREHTFTARDEDVLCRLDLRARVEPGKILIRRVALLGVADMDSSPDTQPKCVEEEDPSPARIALGLSQFAIELAPGRLPALGGHVVVRAPAALANRFVKMAPLTGWAAFAGDVGYDGTSALPEVNGKLHGEGIALERYKLAQKLEATVQVHRGRISIPRFETRFAEGVVVVHDATIDPLVKGAPLAAARVDGDGVEFSGLMRDLGVTPGTVVNWGLTKTRVTKVKGTLAPLHLDAELAAETKNFEVFDRAFHDPARRHMIGVKAATVRARLGVRPDALEFYDARTSFGKSSLVASLVSIGFHNDVRVEVGKSRIDLADISPLVDIPWAGIAELEVKMAGKSGDPLLTGDLAIQKFEFGGFPLGDIKSGKARFRPLKVDFFDVKGRKGKSDFTVSTARLDFDTNASLVVDANVGAERFDLRDFLAMFLFDQDPRFEPIHGAGKVDARVHYVLGGPQDRCGGGNLTVSGSVALRKLDLFEERYDSGNGQFEMRWPDRNASYLGIELDVPSMTLTKGNGTLLGSLSMRQGGKLQGQLIGTAVPLGKIDSLGSLGVLVDGSGSGVAEIDGTLDELAFTSHVRVSPVRVGSATLPASELGIQLVPKKKPLKVLGRTRCGGAITPPFDRAQWDADPSDGTFHVSGKMFGKQVAFSDLRISRQRNKRVEGDIAFKGLDVGSLAQLSPAVAASEDKLAGRLDGSLRIDELWMERPASARGKLELERLEVQRGALAAQVLAGAKPIHLADGRLSLEGLAIAVQTPSGRRATFDVAGRITELGANAHVDAKLKLRPLDLATLSHISPRVERVEGKLAGALEVSGPVRSLVYRGGFALNGGKAELRGMSSPISDINMALRVENDEIRLTQASARVGSGTLKITGSAPLRGFEIGDARAQITARDISLPLSDGVKSSVDADLVVAWQPPAKGSDERSLPRLTGDVTLKSFEYTRPVTMTADIASLAQRGKRTRFEAYDPADDVLEVDLTIKSNRALKLKNNLIEAELLLDDKGLTLGGTNQRFGLRGEVKLKQGGHIKLRRNDFEIRQGVVRFDDLTRIAPQVDVTAVTEYRRYDENVSDKGAAAAPGASGSASGGTAAQGGRWRISMRAHGDADKLRIDLTSDPALAQDDIFLLLTVGVTRAELDQAQSTSVGESVALEALGTLSGADRAVTEALPVIDEFRFGSAYSSRTGRTEPTVTIGKRLAERIRANVTSGLAESREIRSNLEWRLSNRVSLEGSYDNVNDISSSSLGNLGADVRWRLEFE